MKILKKILPTTMAVITATKKILLAMSVTLLVFLFIISLYCGFLITDTGKMVNYKLSNGAVKVASFWREDAIDIIQYEEGRISPRRMARLNSVLYDYRTGGFIGERTKEFGSSYEIGGKYYSVDGVEIEKY